VRWFRRCSRTPYKRSRRRSGFDQWRKPQRIGRDRYADAINVMEWATVKAVTKSGATQGDYGTKQKQQMVGAVENGTSHPDESSAAWC
jgi:hypothetical protein